jgi:hypothetical protein
VSTIHPAAQHDGPAPTTHDEVSDHNLQGHDDIDALAASLGIPDRWPPMTASERAIDEQLTRALQLTRAVPGFLLSDYALASIAGTPVDAITSISEATCALAAARRVVRVGRDHDDTDGALEEVPMPSAGQLASVLDEPLALVAAARVALGRSPLAIVDRGSSPALAIRRLSQTTAALMTAQDVLRDELPF